MELKWRGNQDMFWNQNLQDLSLKGSNPNENFGNRDLWSGT